MAWVSIHADGAGKTVVPQARQGRTGDGHPYTHLGIKVHDVNDFIVDELDLYMASPEDLHLLGVQIAEMALEMIHAAPEAVTK